LDGAEPAAPGAASNAGFILGCYRQPHIVLKFSHSFLLTKGQGSFLNHCNLGHQYLPLKGSLHPWGVTMRRLRRPAFTVLFSSENLQIVIGPPPCFRPVQPENDRASKNRGTVFASLGRIPMFFAFSSLCSFVVAGRVFNFLLLLYTEREVPAKPKGNVSSALNESQGDRFKLPLILSIGMRRSGAEGFY